MTDLAKQLVGVLRQSDGVVAGYRVNHAQGILIEGTFKAAAESKLLTNMSLMSGDSAAVLLRFSDSSGLPNIAQNDSRANPRGIALRLTAKDGTVTDFVGHSAPGFPAAMPEEFANFLKAVNHRESSPALFEAYLDNHSSARQFIDSIPLAPSSYASERYHMLHAFLFRSTTGEVQVGRLEVEPLADERMDDSKVSAQPRDFLHREIRRRIARGPVEMHLVFVVADINDPTDDITMRWPEDRRRVILGTIVLNRIGKDQDRQQKIMFDPGRLAPGIEAVGDPMLLARSSSYRLAFAQRTNERRKNE